MAEALGAIASIVGIISAGAQLSIALFEFASTIGSAGSEVRAIGTEISLFCSVLKQLERTLAKAKDRRYSISAIETTQEILNQCQIIFNEIEAVINGLQTKKAQSAETTLDFKARLKWTMKRSKVQMNRTLLESYKITLHIMLTTLEFAQSVSHRRISTVETDFEDQQEEMIAQSLLFARKCAVEKLEKLEEEHPEMADLDSELRDTLTHEKKDVRPDWNAILYCDPAKVEDDMLLTEQEINKIISARLERMQHKRTSAWLNDLVSEDNASLKARRHSSATNSSSSSIYQLPHLLWKWTDQGEHWDQLHDYHRDEPPVIVPDVTPEPNQEQISDTVSFYSGPILSPSGKVSQPYQKTPLDQSRILSLKKLTHRPKPLSLDRNFERNLSISVSPTTPTPPIVHLAPKSPMLPQTMNNPKNSHSLATPPATPKPLPSLQTGVFKSLHIEKNESCEQILPRALQTYGLQADWRQYGVWLVYDGHERMLEPSQRPLELKGYLLSEGRQAKFMIRKLRSEDMEMEIVSPKETEPMYIMGAMI